ncbi:hypothetical protein X768_16715 [Mesorhizobium sp. LSJC265A00]|uniref:hypothetical protein n=1 Tax=Mesorhizobium sp. LSJC265A00 TaxID=1287322 RepID=UPI0003CF97BA|nr:hypothetical protein [Mesorhizobium sp. LSJC265A00]ESX09980.1 hypothetical protein X768_16715 [Mesorhizobium sp. LSJC265A00]
MEAGILPRILNAIQGQAPRTVAETYGEVNLKTMVAQIAKLPTYPFKAPAETDIECLVSWLERYSEKVCASSP